jgi:hypothetical protein
MRPVTELPTPSPEEFRSRVVSGGQPVVIRRMAASWPLVIGATQDAERCMAMLSAHASEAPVEILRADPAEEGRFHYTSDGRSLNFVRGRASLPVFLAALREQAASNRPYAIVAQGLVAERHVPGFAESHPMPFAPSSAEPRLWIGNAAKVATHNDPTHNIAVVAAGRRRFTLFPPEAEAELYMGPAHPTPAGTPVSMVHVSAPDGDLYPRFASALEKAEEAELFPGDAIFIPRDWFHHVEALERFNVLVNYWWDPNSGESQ